MITLSSDPQTAEKQIEAIIFYLTTCGYVDSEFDLTEKAFVRSYLRKVVTARIDSQGDDLDPEARFEAIEKQHEHYVERFQEIDRDVKELFTEAVADGEDVQKFVHSKLKLRCYEMFKDLDEQNQVALLKVVDDFINADGVVHPEEVKFRNELAALLEQETMIEEIDAVAIAVDLEKPITLAPEQDNHPFFSKFEHHYSRGSLVKQMEADLKVLESAGEIRH